MPVTTFDQFGAGLDLRKGAAVSDANRLLKLDNAHVTTGLAITKRRGLARFADLTPGTKGLFAAFGKLHTFYGPGTITHPDGKIVANKVAQNADGTSANVSKVNFADVFMGFIYASVSYTSNARRHHYLNGRASSLVTDVNCPHTRAVIKAASKMFAAASGGVRMSAGVNALDWSTANDAAFLGTELYSRGDRQVTGLGQYKNELVVFMRDGIQAWTTDPDPRKFSLRTTLENVGTSYPNSISNVGLDLYFLSDYGFRSITTMQYSSNLSDVDVGSPIDSLIRPIVRNISKLNALDPATIPNSIFFYGTGQYICTFLNEAFVYTTSKTSGLAAWSRYLFNVPGGSGWLIDGMAELNQQLYVRVGDVVYQLSEDVFIDDTKPFQVLIQMPYINFKKPSSLKRLYGIDLVTTGTCFVSVGWDSNNPDAFTPEIEVTGNTRTGDLIPIECTGTEFSVRIRNFDNKPFRFDAVSLHWDDLGVI